MLKNSDFNKIVAFVKYVFIIDTFKIDYKCSNFTLSV